MLAMRTWVVKVVQLSDLVLAVLLQNVSMVVEEFACMLQEVSVELEHVGLVLQEVGRVLGQAGRLVHWPTLYHTRPTTLGHQVPPHLRVLSEQWVCPLVWPHPRVRGLLRYWWVWSQQLIRSQQGF